MRFIKARFLAIVSIALVSLGAAGSAQAATPVGTWSTVTDGDANTPAASNIDIVKKGATAYWEFEAGDTDSPTVTNAAESVGCLNADPSSDGAGVATGYVRYQPEGGASDENLSFRVQDSAGADRLLQASDPCVSVPRAPAVWFEVVTECAVNAPDCVFSLTGR